MRPPIFLLALLAAGGCRPTPPPVAAPRSVKVVTASDAGIIDKDFAGMATADRAVTLAFKVEGQLLDIPVTEGRRVVRGELLAELDPRDVRLKVDADRSAYDEARSQLQRMKRLVEHEAVSRQDYEAAQTRFSQAH